MHEFIAIKIVSRFPSIFRISVRSFTGFFKVHIDSKKKEESATVPKDDYCFLETKERMHNEVGTCEEILPSRLLRIGRS